MLILIAGPYRSGTGDDPVLMAGNLATLEAVALPLFRKGHIPMIGEWVALPLVRLAGNPAPSEEIWTRIQYAVAERLLDRCEAVLRLEGKSTGADNDVRLAMARGIPVYHRVEDIPNAPPK